MLGGLIATLQAAAAAVWFCCFGCAINFGDVLRYLKCMYMCVVTMSSIMLLEEAAITFVSPTLV